MPMPLTLRNLAICHDCLDCVSGGRCRFLKRKVKMKVAAVADKEYWDDWYLKNKEAWKLRRDSPFEKLKGKAQRAVKIALSHGDLKKPLKCEFCHKNEELVAHHPNYNDFFKVVWCCKACHRKLHRKT